MGGSVRNKKWTEMVNKFWHGGCLNINTKKYKNKNDHYMFRLTHNNNKSILIAETGASDHYIDSKNPKYKKSDIRHPIRIALPNGSFLKSTQITHLPLTTLKKEAVKAHIVQELKNTSMLSIGRLCN